jgi:hypothetical protein
MRQRIWSTGQQEGLLRADVAVIGFALIAVAALSGSPTAGLETAAGGTALVIGCLAIPRQHRLGVLLAVLILAGVDALPGPDLDTTIVKAGLYEQDVVVIMLILLLLADNVRHRFGGILETRLGRFLLIASLLNLAWWFATLYRTSLNPLLSITHSANAGFAALTVALLVPLMAGTLQRANVRNAMLVTVGCWSVFEAVVYVLASVGHGHGLDLLHPTNAIQQGSTLRVYAPAEDLFSAVLAISVAAALLSPSARVRRFAAVIATVNLLAVVVELTRAQYLGTTFGLIVAMAIWMRGPLARVALRRLIATAVLGVAIISAAFVLAPQGKVANTVSSTAQRITSIGSATSSNQQTSTLAVRASEASLLEQRLGGHALFGLGFISPRDLYDPSLPFGSIFNSDVGVLNIVMSMGIVGAVLYYLSLLGVSVALVARARKRLADNMVWLALGTLAACLSVLGTSVTLVTFFSPTGIVTVATMLGLGAAVVLAPPATGTELSPIVPDDAYARLLALPVP